MNAPKKRLRAALCGLPLTLAAPLGLVAVDARADLIDPAGVTATASGETYLAEFNNLGTNVANVVNGVGLDEVSPDGLHATIFNDKTFMHGNEIEVDCAIVIDLGDVYDLEKIYFWNYNSHNGFFQRGLASFDVEASVDGDEYALVFDDFAVEQAVGGDNHPSKTYDFQIDGVRFVRLSNLQTIENGSGNGGFAEILFDGVLAPTDADDDGTADDEDNCPDDANEDQADNDLDGEGDVCDPDDDNDGVDDTDDNCPLTENADQADADDDGQGDACDDVVDTTGGDTTDGTTGDSSGDTTTGGTTGDASGTTGTTGDTGDATAGDTTGAATSGDTTGDAASGTGADTDGGADDGGCGCTSGGDSSPLSLSALLGLALVWRRRRR
jgi:MYXO-CTERM domain-containing protein